MLTISQIFENTGRITRSKSERILREIRKSSERAIADKAACAWFYIGEDADGVYVSSGEGISGGLVEFIDTGELFEDAYSRLAESPELLTADVVEQLNAVVGDGAVRRVIVRAFVEHRRQELRKADKRVDARRLWMEERRERYLRYLESPEWLSRRQAVLKRDSWTCQDCGAEDEPLDVHHLSYRNFGHEPLEDLISLCRDCHDRAHGAAA